MSGSSPAHSAEQAPAIDGARLRALMESGQLAEAETQCVSALQAAPDSADMLALMAAVQLRRGNADSAIEWQIKASKSPAATAAHHHVLANLYQDQNKLDRAIVSYRRAIKLDGSSAELYNDLGTAYFTKGFLDDATKNFRESIARRADHDIAHANLGAALRRQGRIRDARHAYQTALAIRVRRALGRWIPALRRASTVRPRAGNVVASLDEIQRARAAGDLENAQSLAESLVNANPASAAAARALGGIYLERKYFASAIELCSRALTIEARDAMTCLVLGRAYLGLNAAGDAVRCFQNAIALDDEIVDAHLHLAHALHQLDRDQEAERSYRAALLLEPGLADATVGLALVLRDQDRLPEALSLVRQIPRLESQPVDVINRAGTVLLSDPESTGEAMRLFELAYRIAPNPVPPLVNLGLAGQNSGNLAAASHYYRLAQKYEPWNIPANFNESVVSLLEGDFKRGWEKYHWRSRLGGHKYSFPTFPERRLWDGAPLEAKSIFVHGEQGLGDEIMFASCFPDLIGRANRCVIGCDTRLEALFRRSFPAAEVVGEKPEDRSKWQRTAPPTDYYLPAGGLPYFFRRAATEFPAHAGYLRADEKRVSFWRRRLDGIDGQLKIGLSWRGGRTVSWSPRRSLSLERLLPLLSVPGATFVNLQYGERQAEIDEFLARRAIPIQEFSEAIDAYDETAALCSALDLTISVCTAVVHLNGALGRPVWVLAPYVPEWRYGIRGEAMPWYPSARVFRQSTSGDWAPVIERVREQLAQRIAARPG